MTIEKRYLDFEEQEDLLKVCEESLKSASVSLKESDFLTDMAERYSKWRDRLQVSEKQWKWVQIIGEKVGVSV